MTVKPPSFLRICWGGNIGWPDEEDYPRESSHHGTAGRRSINIRRHKDAVPDRWILDLFLSHMTHAEIAQRCGIQNHTVGDKIKELLDAGIITEQQRRERRATIATRRNNDKSRMMCGPGDKRSDMALYRQVIRHYSKSSNARETARAIGVASATVSRYVRFHNQQRKAKEVA